MGEFRSEPEKWQDRLQNIVTPVYVKLTVGEELREQFNEDTKLNPDWRSIYKHATTLLLRELYVTFSDTLLNEKFGKNPIHLHQVFETLNQKEGLPSPFENEPFAMLVWCGPEKEHVNLYGITAQALLLAINTCTKRLPEKIQPTERLKRMQNHVFEKRGLKIRKA